MSNSAKPHKYYSGQNPVAWFGVVEDLDDPLKLDRARVRILGYHSANTNDIPTSKLPWAIQIHSIFSASVSGLGLSGSGLVTGSWVFGLFVDGDHAQQPVILGTYPGVPDKAADTTKGFNDPTGTFPTTDQLNEPDTNRLSRNESIEKTVVTSKKDLVESNVPTPFFGLWSEPETPYNASYPKNKVFQSESGHIIEIDDTPGAERIHIYHKSGTFMEIHPDGTVVTKTQGDNYSIHQSNDFVYIKGNCNITVDGTTNLLTKGSLIMQTHGDVTHSIGGDYNVTVGGEYNVTANKDANITSIANTTIRGAMIDFNP